MITGEGRSSVGISAESALANWLDLIRWMAAAAVVFSHMNTLFFVKLASLPSSERTPEQLALAIVSGFGRPAVIVFFVLSGYLVGGGSLRQFEISGQFDLKGYLVARFVRLWVVLLPALIYVAIVNYLGISMLGVGSEMYAQLGDQATHFYAIVRQYLYSVFFIPPYQIFGGDDPLWSLFNEFWYYMLWAVGMSAFASRRNIGHLVLCGVVFMLFVFDMEIGSDLRDNAFLYFPVWLAGVYAAKARSSPLPGGARAAGGVFLLSLLVWRALSPVHEEVGFAVEFSLDVVVAIAFAQFLVALRLGQAGLAVPPGQRWHKIAAGFSFSLYVLHYPTLKLFAALAVTFAGAGLHLRPVGVLHYLYGLGSVAGCMVIAHVFSRHTEEKTLRIRSFVIDKLNALGAKELRLKGS